MQLTDARNARLIDPMKALVFAAWSSEADVSALMHQFLKRMLAHSSSAESRRVPVEPRQSQPRAADDIATAWAVLCCGPIIIQRLQSET